jgi:hypothetical protein
MSASFQLIALPAEQFAPLFSQSDAELEALGAPWGSLLPGGRWRSTLLGGKKLYNCPAGMVEISHPPFLKGEDHAFLDQGHHPRGEGQ